MKRFFVAILVLTLAAGVTLLVAQEHSKDKKASDEISISTPIMIGGHMLEAGKYRVACDTNQVTFTRVSNNETLLTLPCKGKDMGKKAENTEIHSELNAQGVRVVTKLLIRGSNIEHVF